MFNFLGWFRRAKSKAEQLFARIRGAVDRADEIAQVSAQAALALGDRLASFEPEDLPWLYGTVATAVAQGQLDGIGMIGAEKFAAVKLAVIGAQKGVIAADNQFDTRWASARPFIEMFIAKAKDSRKLGFSHG